MEVPEQDKDLPSSQSTVVPPTNNEEKNSTESLVSVAARLLVAGVSSATILESMVENGISEKDGMDSISAVKAWMKSACMRSFYWGVFWIILGASISLITYAAVASNPQGGTYYILWGLAVFGLYKCIKSLYKRVQISRL